jgi:hypothetical protein
MGKKKPRPETSSINRIPGHIPYLRTSSKHGSFFPATTLNGRPCRIVGDKAALVRAVPPGGKLVDAASAPIVA